LLEGSLPFHEKKYILLIWFKNPVNFSR